MSNEYKDWLLDREYDAGYEAGWKAACDEINENIYETWMYDILISKKSSSQKSDDICDYISNVIEKVKNKE